MLGSIKQQQHIFDLWIDLAVLFCCSNGLTSRCYSVVIMGQLSGFSVFLTGQPSGVILLF